MLIFFPPFLGKKKMGLSGLEPPTSRLSGVRSNLLSYKPISCTTLLLVYFIKMPGSRLLSHAVSSIVPSAARIFTVVFGMGTGVPSARITTRQNLSVFSNLPRKHAMLRPPGSRIAASIRIPTVLRTAPCSCPYVRQGLTNAHARMAFAQLFLTVFAHMRT